MGSRVITQRSSPDVRKGFILEIRDTRSCTVTARLPMSDRDVFAALSHNGKYIVTSDDLAKTFRFWSILPASAGPPPAWCVDFLHDLAEERVSANGELEPMPVTEWLEIRQRLQALVRKNQSAQDPYNCILRRFVPVD